MEVASLDSNSRGQPCDFGTHAAGPRSTDLMRGLLQIITVITGTSTLRSMGR